MQYFGYTCLAGTAMHHIFFKICVSNFFFFYHSASILRFIQVSLFTFRMYFVFCFTCLFLDHGCCLKTMHSCIINRDRSCCLCLYIYFITSHYSPPLTSGFQDNYIHCFEQCKGFNQLFFTYGMYLQVFN